VLGAITGRAFFIAGGCIAGVFIFNPGSGHQRDARNGDRCQKKGAPWCAQYAQRRSII